MTWDSKMQEALAADGEKLRQLTGEDHGPYFDVALEPPQHWFTCDACDGSGVHTFGTTVYEHGCGFSHASSDEEPCGKCKGEGGWMGDAECDPPLHAGLRDG